MYNRYLQQEEQETYAPIPEENPCQGPAALPPPQRKDGLTSFLRHLLDQFHLDSLDTGDLLLLALLFLLFRENADDELLIALGLLLIL